MDGSFACPECGSSVEIAGSAPGRQVRCGFCHRLVEVPYLPRVPAAGWKRRRFGQWKWVRWAWAGVAVVVVVAVVVTGMRMLDRAVRSAHEGTIKRMLESSRASEAEGRLDQALVELDAAIDLMRRAGDTPEPDLETEQQHRAELARREAGATLDRLLGGQFGPDPIGNWLNLVARAQKDPDLSTLRSRVETEFRKFVRSRGGTELDLARREASADRVVPALRACDRIAPLLRHLGSADADELRGPTEQLVDRMVRSHGVVLVATRGDFVLGSFDSYRARLLPVLARALETRNYLPFREDSPWKSAWRHARYELRLQVSERQEGNYMSSQNRLTRIDAHLVLSADGRVDWETKPTARTSAPLPGLPAYLSARIAVSRERSEEFERLLYENARGQIDGKFGQALDHMPACCP